MRFLFLTALLLTPAMALAQDAAKPAAPDQIETIHSDAERYIETIDVLGRDWIAAGTRPQDYRMGAVATAGSILPEAFVIKAKPGANSGYMAYGTWMQIHAPGPFLGKRVRFSARVKTENVHWAQIWMRVDHKNQYSTVDGKVVMNGPPLSFYNMDDRPIRGTTGWKLYEVVLDMPANGDRLAYGVCLAGGDGTAWMDSATLEVVDDTVPVSRMQGRAPYY